YKPIDWSGWAEPPGGYGQSGKTNPPLDWKQLLPNQQAVFPYMFEELIGMQAPLLQPLGGMDRIAEAIYDQFRPSVRLNAAVTAIRRSGSRVRVELRDRGVEADFCLCTIPANILGRIPNDFSAAKK